MAVVCGFDFSPSSIEAAEAGAAIARAKGDRLVLLHIRDALGAELDDSSQHVARVQKEADRLGAAGALAVDVRVVAGTTTTTFCEVSTDEGADLVLLGARGLDRSIAARVLGASHEIAYKNRAPVIVVRARAPFLDWTSGRSPLRLVVAVDVDERAEAATAWAASLAAIAPIDGEILHVAESDAAARVAETDLAPRLSGLLLRTIVDRRQPAEVIAEEAARQSAGLVVLARHRHSLAARLLRRTQVDRLLSESVTNIACVG
jgi:nucleotide-binding universal stress UspA family protein